MNVFLFTKILSTLTLGAHITLALFFIIGRIKLSVTKRMVSVIKKHLKKNGLLYALSTAILATMSPLIYTYAYYFTPCTLCWYQRIFMFPLIIILFIAHIRKDFKIKIYIYALSIAGLCVGVYHYLSQQLHSKFDIDMSGCDAIGMSASCSEHYFMEYGYITIPLMAMTGFILIIFFTYFAKEKSNIEQKQKKSEHE